jgi:hypothetical protein
VEPQQLVRVVEVAPHILTLGMPGIINRVIISGYVEIELTVSMHIRKIVLDSLLLTIGLSKTLDEYLKAVGGCLRDEYR